MSREQCTQRESSRALRLAAGVSLTKGPCHKSTEVLGGWGRATGSVLLIGRLDDVEPLAPFPLSRRHALCSTSFPQH